MPTIIKNPVVIKIVKTFLLIVGITIGLYVGAIMIQAIFNLGVSFGTFLRCLYQTVVVG